jgi:hypothetical protein
METLYCGIQYHHDKESDEISSFFYRRLKTLEMDSLQVERFLERERERGNDSTQRTGCEERER